MILKVYRMPMCTNRVLLCVLFMISAGGGQLRCMDTQGVDQPYNALSLPNDLWVHIAFACKTDEVSKEAFLAHLMKLREVCTAWRDRLNDQFIADLVDLRIKAESYQELEDCLAQAVKDEDVTKIVMICKLYPNVSRVKALKATLSKKLIVNNQSVKYLKLLIDLGADPDSQMGKWCPFICYLFERFRLDSNRHDHVYDACIDLLLNSRIDTTCNFLLDRAANNYCVYGMYKLLRYPIPHKANLTKVLGALCRNLIMHDKLLEVCHTLLARGAKVPEGNLILERPVELGILPMVLLLLQHGATLENSEWLCKNMLEKYGRWPNQEEAKVQVPEIIACALDRETRSLVWYRKRLNEVLEGILRKQGDGSYFFGGTHFYPCLKKLFAIGLRRVDCFEEDRDNCIHILLSQSDPKLVDLALELKFPFDTWKDSKTGQTALHILAAKNDVTSLQKLLVVGFANIDVLDSKRMSPLAHACLYGARDAVNYLVRSGANIGRAFGNASAEACVQHVCYGQDDSIHQINCPVCGIALCGLRKFKWFLDNDAWIIGLHTMYVQTLADQKMHMYGHLVTYLIKNESLLKSFYTKYPNLINAVDQNGDTVLHHAIKNLHAPVVQYLIQQPHCNVNICNNEGKRPLELIPHGGYHDGLRDILIAHGACVEHASRRIVAPAVIHIYNGVLDPLPVPPVAVRSVRSEPIVIQHVRQPVVPVPHDNSQSVQKTFTFKPHYMFGIATVLVAGYTAYRYWWRQTDDEDAQESVHEQNTDSTESHSVVT